MRRAARHPGAWLALAAGLTLGLAGCSSEGGTERLTGSIVNAVVGSIVGQPAPQPDAPVTRAELEAIGGPIISVRRGDSQRVFVLAATVNRDYVTYEDTARRGLTLRGGAITGTTNFGIDIAGVAVQTDDPVVNPTPPQDWPASITRVYKLYRRDRPIESFTFRCLPVRVGPVAIEVVERRRDTVEIVEACTNGSIEFENRHFADAETGFIWKTTQWIGPLLSPVTLEIVTPYTPG